MRHRRAGKKLGRDSAHRKALYSNLAGALIELTGIDPLVGGIVLIAGCPALLIAGLRRDSRAIAPIRRSAA